MPFWVKSVAKGRDCQTSRVGRLAFSKMLRSASVKSVLQTKESEALRDPEHVERVWDEAVDGAWAVGKAPLLLLSELLQHVQDENLEQAELTASEILTVEPNNKLVQDLIAAMKQQQTLEDQLESEEESEEDEDEEEDDDDEDDEDAVEEEQDESPENEHEEK